MSDAAPVTAKMVARSLRRPRPQRVATFLSDVRGIAPRLRSPGRSRLAQLLREQCTAGHRDHREASRRTSTILAILAESFRRVHGIDVYDVQLVAAWFLAQGSVVEMQTGEGKTLAAALAAGLYSLSGRGVHVMTANQYLARRDYDWVRPVFDELDVSIGLIDPSHSVSEIQRAYQRDVTYGCGSSFGFDFLRDSLTQRRWLAASPSERMRARWRRSGGLTRDRRQRGCFVAVVDEADSIMIDDAITPLILAEAKDGDAQAALWLEAVGIANSLLSGRDYIVDDKQQRVMLTTRGAAQAKDHLTPGVQRHLRRPWQEYVELALYGIHFLHRDVHYVIRDATLSLVDANTGRIFPDRSWRGGLRQAVEAKEGLSVTPETESAATIARQAFLRHYRHLCGLTGTAVEVERELREVYGVTVQVVPPRLPCRRKLLPTLYFPDRQSKWSAIVAESKSLAEEGRPVLVGTNTIDESRELAHCFREQGSSVALLNGVQDADEAAVISRAGCAGRITVATNMAGRGTDIKLDEAARERGGLHVIGCQRHASARIDRQLLGRCARQGDPGTARFMVSAEDELLVSEARGLSERIRRTASEAGTTSPKWDGEIEQLQSGLERLAAESREDLLRRNTQLNDVVRRVI